VNVQVGYYSQALQPPKRFSLDFRVRRLLHEFSVNGTGRRSVFARFSIAFSFSLIGTLDLKRLPLSTSRLNRSGTLQRIYKDF
jgi:hypothetical protein